MSGRVKRGKVELAHIYAAIPLRPPAPWWQRLFSRTKPACAHAGAAEAFVLTPDQVRLRGGAESAVRQPPRPPITVCRACLLTLLEQELKSADRRIIAFEPPKEGIAEYAFIEQQHLGDSGLRAEDIIHCQSLMAEPLGGCQKCGHPALVLLVKAGITTKKGKLATYRGGKEYYCSAHGRERLLGLLRERLPTQTPVRYFNFPYGERGVYVPAE